MTAPSVPSSHPVLRVLLLEDSALDAELVTEALAGTGLATRIERVISAGDFRAAVSAGEWDLILADYVLPAFDGLGALAMARDRCPDTPFIFVSGTLGEEVAVEALKLGATDYVVKQRLERLPRTVLRALSEASERRQRQQAQAELHRLLEERTSLLHELDHRVKNNVQLLLSLLGIEIRQAGSAEVRSVLCRVKERLQALATIHREPYEGRHAGRFDAAAFVRNLCAELTSSMERVKITPEFGPEAIAVAAGKAAPLALLFNEVIVNALSHADPERHGRLGLRLRVRDGRLVFALSDEALSPREKAAARDGSSGTILKALTRQLDADVEWPDDDPGVLVRVTMPLEDEPRP